MQALLRHCRDIRAIYRYPTTIKLVKACDEISDRTLSRTRLPHEGDMFSSGDGKGKILYRIRLSIFLIREGHVFKTYRPLCNPKGLRTLGILDLGFCVHDLDKTLK